MNHPLQCRCGSLKGFIKDPQRGNAVVCYCKDCQAFAHFLGRADEVLDERGGSTVFQVLPKSITLTQGTESLACMRLTHKGLVRWYAKCCNTPIGNTLSSPGLSFIGLVHSCLDSGGGQSLDAFGPIRSWVNTQSAKGEPKPRQKGIAATVGWFIGTVLKARINGDYKHTPFFTDKGILIVPPRVLTSEERAELMKRVG